jgi:hypothetical protein
MFALCALLGACHDTRPDGQVFARVDGRDITETELAAEARAAPGTRAELLERLVGRALLAEAAHRREADLSPLYLADLRRAREMLLVDSLRRQIAAHVPLPDDAHARAFLLAHPWAYATRAQVTLVAQDGAATGIDTATLDQSTAASVGSAAIGTGVAIGGLSYRVAARKALPVAPAAALADARSMLVAQEVDRQMRAILVQSRADATIHYQPGFGPAQER